MSLSSLTSVGPVDGRYYSKTKELSQYFSEYGLIYHRLVVEVEWLKSLSLAPDISEIPTLDAQAEAFLDAIISQFDEAAANRVKAIEATTNHDVKAVEYYLKERLNEQPTLAKISEFVHFAATSEDINNLAYALMQQKALSELIQPAIHDVSDCLTKLAKANGDTPMLSRTHGQAATPTTVGKELANSLKRLQRQIEHLNNITFMGKCNGAVGNFNAHYVAYPDVDWQSLSDNFIERLGLTANHYTTQIEPHDYIAELSHAMSRINTVLIDLARDCWHYISLNYFSQQSVSGEVGSSTMPHKVNPIDFENAEGNLGLANALFGFFADKLPVSRLQRDLSDSTVLRNIGVAYAHSLISYQSLIKGLNKLVVNRVVLDADLDANWAILAEPIQTVMRRYGIEKPYEKLKTLTRNQTVTRENLHAFIDSLTLSDSVKAELLALTPANYLGLATTLSKNA